MCTQKTPMVKYFKGGEGKERKGWGKGEREKVVKDIKMERKRE